MFGLADCVHLYRVRRFISFLEMGVTAPMAYGLAMTEWSSE